MKCSSCNKTISDSSGFCLYCGAEQEVAFCNACGTARGTKSSKKSGVVLVIILLTAAILIYLTGKQEVKFSPSTGSPVNLQEKNNSASLTEKVSKLIFKDAKEKEYDVLFSTTIDFGDSKTHEVYLLVKEGESKHNQIEFAKREIRAKSEYAPADVVILYICADSACREKGNYLAKLVSVNLELNPGYVVEEGLLSLTDSLFLKWESTDE